MGGGRVSAKASSLSEAGSNLPSWRWMWLDLAPAMMTATYPSFSPPIALPSIIAPTWACHLGRYGGPHQRFGMARAGRTSTWTVDVSPGRRVHGFFGCGLHQATFCGHFAPALSPRGISSPSTSFPPHFSHPDVALVAPRRCPRCMLVVGSRSMLELASILPPSPELLLDRCCGAPVAADLHTHWE